jgi:hypothetical protein
MKPVVRWTIGPVSDIGFEILNDSINFFTEAYPEFDYFICYNKIDLNKIKIKKKHKISFIFQEEFLPPCLLTPPDNNLEEASGCGWKLVPPRLRIGALELFIDNDIIIRNRMPSIDKWLSLKNYGLISEGLNRKRMFGKFDNFIPSHIRACAGLFGLPVNFDFNKQIKYYSSHIASSLGGYDEQGLTVASIVNIGKYIMVPLSSLYISEDHVPFPEKIPDGIHFVGANRKPWHRGWHYYKSIIKSIKMI